MWRGLFTVGLGFVCGGALGNKIGTAVGTAAPAASSLLRTVQGPVYPSPDIPGTDEDDYSDEYILDHHIAMV